MDWFKKKKETQETRAETPFDTFLSALISNDDITKEEALNIPSVATCVEFISNTVAQLPIKLYQSKDDKITELKDDIRCFLLNDETGDLLNGFDFKKALVKDLLLDGNAYAYIGKNKNTVTGLYYVDSANVSKMMNADPIFKICDFIVNGRTYRDFEFLKIVRQTKNGITGKGIIQTNGKALIPAYNTMLYENVLALTGGNKKGFFLSDKKLDEAGIKTLKESYGNLYKNNSENAIILNNGLKFQEASSTPVEMQINENKVTNANEICKIFSLPPALFTDKCTDEIFNIAIKMGVIPILKQIETALNRDILLESEKKSFYFAFDTKDLLKGDVEKRYKAYSEAVKAGWMSKNEIRYIEDLPAIDGLDVVSMSLGDVIFDIKTQKYFTPNMGNTIDVKQGGEKVEN